MVKAATAPLKPWRRAASQLRVAEALVQRHVETKRGRILFVRRRRGRWSIRAISCRASPRCWSGSITSRRPAPIGTSARMSVPTCFMPFDPAVTTYAFEPSPSNYLAMCVNVYENGRQDNVNAYCLAFNDRNRLATLDMDDLNAGAFGHSFGELDARVSRPDHKTIFHQPVLGSLDRRFSCKDRWSSPSARLSEARCRRQRGEDPRRRERDAGQSETARP